MALTSIIIVTLKIKHKIYHNTSFSILKYVQLHLLELCLPTTVLSMVVLLAVTVLCLLHTHVFADNASKLLVTIKIKIIVILQLYIIIL